jgi:ABC-type uncharacterized transport system permease subunit
MARPLLSFACHAYAVAAIVYLAQLVRPWKALPGIGRVVTVVGLLLHGAGLGVMLSQQGGAPAGLSQGFAVLSFLLLVIFLGIDLRYGAPMLGAFMVPVALTLLTSGLLAGLRGAPLPTEVRAPLLPVHVAIATLGVAAFAVASGVAVMFLLLERQMKGKRFGLWFSRLPSLQFLDELNRRLIVWGFIALTVTLVTGVFFTSNQGLFWQWQSKEVATLIAWAVAGALLNARLLGWRGKRVAVLTMAGFGLLLVSFFSSFMGTGAAGVVQ